MTPLSPDAIREVRRPALMNAAVSDMSLGTVPDTSRKDEVKLSFRDMELVSEM